MKQVIAEKVAKIKQQQRPDLHVWGSGNLIQTLIKIGVGGVFLMVWLFLIARRLFQL